MLITIDAATTRPVSLALAKAHCRIGTADEDTLVGAYLDAAIAYVENETGRILAPKTVQLRLDRWSVCGVEIPHAPVRDITEVSYLDTAGAEQTVDPANWHWDPIPLGARVGFAETYNLPAVALERAGVLRITFDAGYNDPAAGGTGADPQLNLPPQVVPAVLLLTAHWYENREPVTVGNFTPAELPLSIQALIDQLKIYA